MILTPVMNVVFASILLILSADINKYSVRKWPFHCFGLETFSDIFLLLQDIAAMIQQSIEKQGGTMKVMPLLMSFVRGETIEADRHFVSGDKTAAKPSSS
jgi:hypothetical protein